MRFLSVIVFLLTSITVSAQYCDTCNYRDSSHVGILHLRPLNPGIHTNGINVSIAPTYRPEDYLGSYSVNGVDIAYHCYEGIVNGIAISPFMMEVFELNGVSISGGITDHRKVQGLQITGLWTFIYDTLNGASVNGLMVFGGVGNGASLSGMANIYHERFNGLLIAGGYNRVREGFTGTGLTAGLQIFDDYANGLVFSGICTYVDKDAHGLFVSGLGTVADDLHGVSITAGLNFVKEESRGMQIGLVNYAAVSQGIHIGVVNQTNRLQGIQFGLVNINRANPKWCRVTPFMNFNFRPLVEMDTIRKRGEGNYIVKSYYADGTLASIKQFKNYKSNGLQTYYNQNGMKRLEVSYVNGIRNGMEHNYYDGYLETSALWNSDTMVWVCHVNYLGEVIPGLMQYDYTYSRSKRTCIVFDEDTIISMPSKESGLRVESWQDGALIAMHVDSTEWMWWCNSDSKHHNIKKRAQLIYPTQLDTIALNFHSDNSPHEAILRLNDYLYTTDSTFSPDVLVSSWFHLDMRIDRYYSRLCQNSRSYFLAEAIYHWKSGGVKTKIQYDCKTNAEVARTDYFSDGSIYYSWKDDTSRFYSKKGKLVRQDIRNHCETYYANGVVEYDVTSDTLSYFNSSGDLVMFGVLDTMWLFSPSGRVELRIELRQDSALIVKYGSYEDGVRDTMLAHQCFTTGIGVKCAMIVSKEPVPLGIATDCRGCEGYGVGTSDAWFGMSMTRYFSEPEYYQYWIFDGPEEIPRVE